MSLGSLNNVRQWICGRPSFVLEHKGQRGTAAYTRATSQLQRLKSAVLELMCRSCTVSIEASKPLKRDSDAVMSHLFVSILLLPFSSCSTPREPWCSEGRSRLDSVDFLACQQHNLAKLHGMGIWIARALDPNWQVHISTTTY